MGRATTIASDRVFRLERRGPADARATFLIEVPHGATEDAHFEAARSRLEGTLPPDLIAFFRVNTDFGAPELADAAADAATRRDPGCSVEVLRGLVPRTLIDLNREIGRDDAGGMTPGLPPYVVEPSDRRALVADWTRYQEVARDAYARVCGAAGGTAIALHTYAPRSVDVERFDATIVDQLRRAYAPDVHGTWPLRPEADLILPDDGDAARIDGRLVDRLEARLASAGTRVARSSTYRLVPHTMAYRHALDHPDATACLELRRDLVGAPWRPFEPSTIDGARVADLGAAIAEALLGDGDV